VQVQVRWQGPKNKSPWQVFIAEKGWFDKNGSKLIKADIIQNGGRLQSKWAAGLLVRFILRWGAQPGSGGARIQS
jgi:hypothetical protein